MRVLVTGATGYVGGRLVPRLLEAGHEVTVLVRDAARFTGRAGAQDARIIQGDLLEPETLDEWFKGFDAAYYLVHAMHGGAGFARRDDLAARNFAQAAVDCPHVIYLGGLLPQGASEHLQSRAQVGRTLRAMLPGAVSEFRAGPIIGSGSASFEMVRYLTERLPVMITPKWVRNAVQPIAVRDVLAYLLQALHQKPLGVIDIGADRQTFADLMQGYAAQRGLKRRVILPTPFLAPALAARWVGFVTPISNRLAVPLVQGVIHPVVADTQKAREIFPKIEPIPYREAVKLALNRIEKNLVETRWSGSLTNGSVPNRDAFELTDEEGLIREVRQVETDAPPLDVFRECCSVGGDKGWPAWQWAWRLRGWMDKLIGGPGLRRGRRHPVELSEGECVDFWRVERVYPADCNGHGRLRLRAEMKVPGKAWLQWETSTTPQGRTRLTQTAMFEPKGLPGFAYWYACYPVHLFLFDQMARAIARGAEAE